MKKAASLLCGLILLCGFAFLTAFAGAKKVGTDFEWELADQIGGITKALARQGDTLYLASGLHILVLDVRDPRAVLLVGRSPLLPQYVESITLDGSGRLYACCGSGGLAALDVSNAVDLSILWVLDTMGFTENVAIAEGYAMLADGPQGLQIYDITAAEPVFLAEAYPMAYAYDVLIKEGMAYIAGGGSGLFCVDVTDPGRPHETGLVSTDGFIYDVAFSGDLLYAACAWGGVSVFSLKDPQTPVKAEEIRTDGWAMSLHTSDKDLWVMEGADGATRYSLSGGERVLTGAYRDCGFVTAGDAHGDTVFLLDLETGLSAIREGFGKSFSRISLYTPLLDARRVTIIENSVYVAGGKSGMHTFDISDPKGIRETDRFDAKEGYANRVVVHGGLAYLSLHLHAENPLVIFDLVDPLHPRWLGGVPVDDRVYNTAFRSLCLGDGYAYIPGENSNAVVDVHDPENPFVTDTILMDNPINGDVRGHLFITTNSYRLQLMDVSDPYDIREVGSMDKNSAGEGIRFLSDTVLLTAADPGLWVVDVSDPTHPVKIAELSLNGAVMDITLDGTTAYLSMLGEGIIAVDVKNPQKPKMIGNVQTNGFAYDCAVKGNMLLASDSIGGLSVYTRTVPSASDDTILSTPIPLPLSFTDGKNRTYNSFLDDIAPPMVEPKRYTVNSTKDTGPGTLRYALETLRSNTLITFDLAIFPLDVPNTISPESPFPAITCDYVTIDASNAGVILEGGKLTSNQILDNSSGLTVQGRHNTLMGLQIYHFPVHGMQIEGAYNRIGGSREAGAGPVGQGNVCSGNKLYGMMVNGYKNTLLGNLVGLDVTGTQPVPNFYGIFVGDWAFYAVIGGTGKGEGNVVSGNTRVNLDSWGDHTVVIGNLFGLDATSSYAVNPDTGVNVYSEAGANDNVFGGTSYQERNVISGAQIGVVFSDPDNYQNSLIGNYIGTDITGTIALPNQTGVTLWTCGTNRVGGSKEGEGNLISGNSQNAILINGYGVTDNIIMGNRIGEDAAGENPLPNRSGIQADMGQWHAVIGGYTPSEGNRIRGSDIAMRLSGYGTRHFYIAGNSLADLSMLGVYLETQASDNFIVNNTIGIIAQNSLRIDDGKGNLLRGNRFTGKPKDVFLLLQSKSLRTQPPSVKKASAGAVSGLASPNGLVEVYQTDTAQALTPLGVCRADAKGRFAFQSDRLVKGMKLVLLCTDISSNTSAFSKVYTVK